MFQSVLRLPVVKQCFTRPVLRACFVAAPLAARRDRRSRMRFLTIYYALSIASLLTVTFLNYSLLSGDTAGLKYHALLLLAISMTVSIIISTHYEKKYRAAHQRMLRESPFRERE